MIGRDRNEAAAAANYIKRHDDSAEIRAQQEHEEFVRQNQEILAQLKSEFQAAPFLPYVEAKAAELGSGMIESWKHAYKREFLGNVGKIYPSSPRPIRLGASVEHFSWASDDMSLPVRAVQGAMLHYRELQGELLPQDGAVERVFARYGMPYQYQDTEEYKERGLFVVAFQLLALDEPVMLSFGELDEAQWRSEGDKLAAIEAISAEKVPGEIADRFSEIISRGDRSTFISNIFDKKVEEYGWIRKKTVEHRGLFRLRERAFIPGDHLLEMEEFTELTEDFANRYHNPLHTDEGFQDQVKEELDIARERVKMGNESTFLAYRALARALKRAPESIVDPEALDPCANLNCNYYWKDWLRDLEERG